MKITRNVKNNIWRVDKAAIKAAWEMFDDDDTSTERLLQLVADACNCTISDVVDVMTEKSND